MGMQLFATVLTVLVLLLVNEFWWRSRSVHGEFSRKFIHLTVGSFVATWPFFLTWHEIEFLSLAFLIVVLISKRLRLFRAIHSVQRPTWGELYFAISVGLIALTTHDKWVYAAALLQMSLADGLAAVLGIMYGGKQRYSVFGHAKSLVGTLTFFMVSAAILVAFRQWGDVPLDIAMLIGISAGATLLENVGVRGLDNLLVPIFVAVLLANQ